MGIRTTAFVDGFNLYHALAELGQNHLKWLDLRRLLVQFAPAPQYELTRVLYFSAYATWIPDAYARHRAYVAALEATGVDVVMGKFKKKPRSCKRCGASWEGHEEKETDVNLALMLLELAYADAFDRALVLSADSDLAPAVRAVRRLFPEQEVRILTPPGRFTPGDLRDAAGHPGTGIRDIHVRRCLFGEEVLDPTTSQIAARRPAAYAPPHSSGAE